jgi:hypothetical protein
MLHFGEGRNKKTFVNPADFIDIPYYFVSGSAVAYNASFHIDFRSIICFNFVKSLYLSKKKFCKVISLFLFVCCTPMILFCVGKFS